MICLRCEPECQVTDLTVLRRNKAEIPLDTGQEPPGLQVAGRSPEGQNRSRYLLASCLLSTCYATKGLPTVLVSLRETQEFTITKSCQDSNAQKGSLADSKARPPHPLPQLQSPQTKFHSLPNLLGNLR